MKSLFDEFGIAAVLVAEWFVEKSAGTLERGAARYREEWLADLRDIPNCWKKLAFAVGTLRATTTLRQQQREESHAAEIHSLRNVSHLPDDECTLEHILLDQCGINAYWAKELEETDSPQERYEIKNRRQFGEAEIEWIEQKRSILRRLKG